MEGLLSTLPRHNTETSKHIFPEKELRGLSPNFYIHVSVSDLYIPTIGLPILRQENMWTDPGSIQGGSDKSGILKVFLENLTAQLKIIRFYKTKKKLTGGCIENQDIQ
jgi:hypothetical protein